MNRVKFSLFTAIFIVTAFTFFACDEKSKKAEAGDSEVKAAPSESENTAEKRESALVGKWGLVKGSAKSNPEHMELLSDGSGIVDKAGITYKTENDRFYLIHPSMATSYSYKVSDSMFVLTKDDGAILEYKKGVKYISPAAKKAAAEQAAALKKVQAEQAEAQKAYKQAVADREAEEKRIQAEAQKAK